MHAFTPCTNSHTLPPPQVDDQLTFNQLVEWNGTVGRREQGHLYPVEAARPDGRVIYDATRVRTIAP